jgi:hypothetical protein
MSEELNKPIENDEPQRDETDLVKQRATGWMTATMGVGDCFHYDRGRFAEIPKGAVLEQFKARVQGWSDVPVDWVGSAGDTGVAGAPVMSADFAHVVGIYSSVRSSEALTLILGLSGDPRIRWGWPTRMLLVDAGAAQLWRVGR